MSYGNQGGGNDVPDNPAAPSGGPDAPPPATNPWDEDLGAFKGALGKINPQILAMRGMFDPSQYQQQLGGLAGQWSQIAQGGNNPIFGAYRDAMLKQVDANANAQLGQTADFFDKRGMGDSGAALNAGQKVQTQADLARTSITGQLGMEQMQQQMGALGQLQGLYGQGFSGQMAGAEGQLGVLGAYLKNAAIPAELSIAGTAAEKAGDVPGQSGGGGTFSVICTLLHERGDLSDEAYRSDQSFARRKISLATFRGYRAWAVPLVRQMRKRAWLYRALRPVARAWATELARRADNAPKARLGAFLLVSAGLPVCTGIGWAMKHLIVNHGARHAVR